MPHAPPKVCCKPGCGALTNNRYCEKHTLQIRKDQDQVRGSAAARGYNYRWQVASKQFLKLPENALCACSCGRPSTCVDHKIPHRGDQTLFWDQSNWQGMTKPCHDRKTALEDGRWGPEIP